MKTQRKMHADDEYSKILWAEVAGTTGRSHLDIYNGVEKTSRRGVLNEIL